VTVHFNGRNGAGQMLPSGVYFYRVAGAGAHVTGKIAILR
jgi:hypothetical protein